MWQPLADRLLVEPIPERRTIILTDPNPIRRYKVLAAGSKVREVRAGDVVTLPGIAVMDPDHREGKLLFVREGDVGWVEK